MLDSEGDWRTVATEFLENWSVAPHSNHTLTQTIERPPLQRIGPVTLLFYVI